jgi:hypothetical protein
MLVKGKSALKGLSSEIDLHKSAPFGTWHGHGYGHGQGAWT